MAAAFMRRSVATAGLAVLATLASPLVGAAFASAPTLTPGTFTPADGGTVAANRPMISATYNTPLNTSTTTISVADTTTATPVNVPCARAFTSDAMTVGCSLSSDLADNHTYTVTVHAVNGDSSISDSRTDTASWTVDIPSVVSTSPTEGQQVAIGQKVTATYDEPIDTTHSTVHVVNGVGNNVPGSLSFSKSGATGSCPKDPCIMTFTSGQSLPTGTYTATLHADGITAGVPSNSDNPNAFVDSVIHFTVNRTRPAVGPQSVVAPAHITQANVKAVPFSGYALPGFNVSVAIYDEYCDQNCDPTGTYTEGEGPVDGLGTTLVQSCLPADAHTVISGGKTYSLCPFSLTVDDSAGCDTGGSESNCSNGSPLVSVKNQWYAFSSASTALQTPASACPSTGTGCPTADSQIDRDTTAPSPPDNSASGYVTNDSPSPGQATVTVSATDSFEAPSGPDAYVVRVSDAYGNSKDVSLAPSAGNLNNRTFAMPSGLFDGDMTIEVAAADSLGNMSSFVTAQTPLNQSSAKEIVPLTTANPNTDSFVGSNGTTYDFSTLSDTTKTGVPTVVTVHFNEPITLKAPNNDPVGSTPAAHICILDSSQLCVNNLQGDYAIPDGDPTALQWTAPAGFADSLADSVYTIAAFAPADNCVTRQPPPFSYSCETSGGTEGDATSWTTLTTFKVDKEAPTIATLSVNPTTITAQTVKSVTVTGTSDPDTRSVQLTIKSSAGGAPRVLTQDVAAPTDPSATSVAWTFFPIDLSLVRDGTLTISAIAIDDAGNKTRDPGRQIAATLAAHGTTLTEKAGSTRIVYGHIVQVTGRLVDANGAGIKNATVSVRPRFSDGSYGAATKGTTDSTGHWGVLVAPAHNATWYASYAGSTTSPLYDASSVHSARTLVKVAIAFTSPKNRSRVGSPVVLKGKVSPNKRGATVAIYRHTSTGKHLLGKVKLNRYSRWTFKLRLPRGTVKLFAVIGNTTGNLGNRTSYLTITH